MDYKSLFIGAFGIMLAAACTGKDGAHADADGHADGGGANPSEIVITPDRAKAAGIVTAVVEPGEFNGVIPCGGKNLPSWPPWRA